jgi:undecaprenyl-diphosphatase
VPYVFVIAFVIIAFIKEGYGLGSPLLLKRNRLEFLLASLLALIIASGIIAPIFHYFYARPRPFSAFGWAPLIAYEAGPSFPSSHATFMFTLAAAMAYRRKKWGYWFFAVAGATGIARAYSLLHYPTDIVFGAVLGMFAAYIAFRMRR